MEFATLLSLQSIGETNAVTDAVERDAVSRPRLLLADDNPAMLDHVSKMLRENFEIVAALRDGASVLREYARLRPEVLVLDITMGEIGGIELAQQLRDAGCDARIVFLTVHEDHDFVNAALGAGGSAYVVKSRLGMDLPLAIKAALAGKLFVSPSLLYAAE